MYTLEMAEAFKGVQPPSNFGVTILDAGDFITVSVDPEDLLKLTDDEKMDAVQYVKDVKQALESAGAIVLVVREAVQ